MPPMTTEIIDLCDSSSDEEPRVFVRARATPVSPDLRTQLRESERARRVLSDERAMLSEKSSRLEQELSEARSRLEELEAKQHAPSMSQMARESDQSYSEIIRYLNQDLERQTQLSADNYSKFQNAKRTIGDYKSVIETLWRACECPVCFEPTWEPAAYTCGHLICQGCATSPACAYCRAPTQGVIKVYAMRDVVRTIAPLAALSSQSPKKTRR